MMASLREHVTVLRSKNVSPYELALDVIFENHDDYERAKQVDLFADHVIAELYGIDDTRIDDVVYYDAADAVKVIIERPTGSGEIGDTDVYGAQQYAPLLTLELPDE